MIITRIRWISPTNRRFLTKIRLFLPKIKHQVDRLQEEEAGQERHHGRGGGAVGVQRRVLGRQEGGTLGGQDRRRGQVVVAEGKKNRALYIFTHNTRSRCQTL